MLNDALLPGCPYTISASATEVRLRSRLTRLWLYCSTMLAETAAATCCSIVITSCNVWGELQ